MICQCCGKCILPNEMYIVKFEGQFLPIKAAWIACDPCTDKLVADLVNCFSPSTLKAVDICRYGIKNERRSRR